LDRHKVVHAHHHITQENVSAEIARFDKARDDARAALQAIKDHPDLELQLVVSGSALLEKYGTVMNFVEADGFRILEKVYTVLEGENPTTMAKSTGLAIMELSDVFNNLRPDVVITIADRYETIATSIAASYQNIPLAHIQGGEVTGNIDEKVRHANTKLADIHFVSSEKARERVIKMGEDPDYVFNTGCPSIDLAKKIEENPVLDFDPIEKYGGVGHSIDWKNGYIVVMQHPVTTEYEQARHHVTETLKAVYELGLPTFWFWPNPDAGSDGTSGGIRAFREQFDPPNIRFFKNMSSEDFLKLIYNAKVLAGNSSVGIRESSYLGIPVVNIGSRQDGRERGPNVTDVNYAWKSIAEAIKKQWNHGKYPKSLIYGDGNAGRKIAELLAGIPLRFHKKLTY
jgi:UDP-hydrolysing UDP-N-acetyl-D-glucosamine 2-epimerase